MYSGYSIGLDVSLLNNTNVNGGITYSFPAGFSPVQNETSFQISNQTNINNSLAVGLSFGSYLGRKSVFNAWLLLRASYTASSFNFDITKAGIPDVFYNNGYDTVRSNNTAFTLELNTHTIHIEPLFRIQLADAPLLFTIGPGVYIPIHQYAHAEIATSYIRNIYIPQPDSQIYDWYYNSERNVLYKDMNSTLQPTSPNYTFYAGISGILKTKDVYLLPTIGFRYYHYPVVKGETLIYNTLLFGVEARAGL